MMEMSHKLASKPSALGRLVVQDDEVSDEALQVVLPYE